MKKIIGDYEKFVDDWFYEIIDIDNNFLLLVV